MWTFFLFKKLKKSFSYIQFRSNPIILLRNLFLRNHNIKECGSGKFHVMTSPYMVTAKRHSSCAKKFTAKHTLRNNEIQTKSPRNRDKPIPTALHSTNANLPFMRRAFSNHFRTRIYSQTNLDLNPRVRYRWLWIEVSVDF